MTHDVVSAVAEATTFLFVPGDRPERFEKAFATGADVVIIDLEDAVAGDNKAAALDATIAALRGEGVPENFRALVRVNATSDVPALVSAGTRLSGVMIPKAESTVDLDDVAAQLPEGLALVALVETGRGIANARELASHPRVTRLAFGAIDFSADVDATAPAVLDYARAELVVASRAAGLPSPIESPSTTFTDLDAVESDSRHARAMGFGGKLCIHPAQLPAVESGFAPTDAEVEWATRVVGLVGGAVQLDGAMVDKPVVDRATRILARRNGR